MAAAVLETDHPANLDLPKVDHARATCALVKHRAVDLERLPYVQPLLGTGHRLRRRLDRARALRGRLRRRPTGLLSRAGTTADTSSGGESRVTRDRLQLEWTDVGGRDGVRA